MRIQAWDEAIFAAVKVTLDAPITANMLDSDSAKAVAFRNRIRWLKSAFRYT